MTTKKILNLGIFCLLLIPNRVIQTADDFIDFDSEQYSLEDSGIEIDLDDIDQSLLDAAAQNTGTTREGEASDVLDLLFEQAHANKILKNDLYRYTFPLATRNIITYPSLLSFTPRRSNVGFNIFYQQTTNMFPWCNNIEGYVALFEPTFMREIDLEIARENNVDIPKMLKLFKNARVEQRRVGFLFDLWKKFDWFNIGLEFPFYAVEKNYNLPIEDIQEIESSDVFESSENEKTEKAAIYRYVLETRIGLGSTRLTLGFDLANKDRFRMVVGTKLTFPTSATLKSGFIGSDFKRIVQRCYLDLETFIEDITSSSQSDKDQALNNAKAFGVQSVNQMSALLLATKLGEDKRFQIGFYVEPTIRVDEQLTLFASFRANWMEPKTVSRFILEHVNCSDFDDANFDTNLFPTSQKEQMSHDAIVFLNNRARNWLFPCCYNVKLKNQRELQLTTAALFRFTDNWNLVIGYDYWHKQQECARIVKLGGKPANLNCIKLDRALLPNLSQQKIFTKVEYTKFKESHNFVFTFGGDLPLLSKNIGDDYTCFVKFEWSF